MKKYLFLPGGAMLVAGVAWAVVASEGRQIPLVVAAGGLLAVAVAVAANWREFGEWRRDPRGVFAVNSVLSAVLLFVILAVIVVAVGLRQIRFDLTESGRNTISADTRTLLRSLGQDVVLKQFGRTRDPQIDAILGAFTAENPSLTLTFVDIERNIQEAKAYGITRLGTVIVESAGAHRKVEQVGELALATAIVQVTSTAERIVCFATGEGERGLADQGATGLSKLADVLTASAYKTDRVALIQEDAPQWCHALIIPGPQSFAPEVRARLETYQNNGGRIGLFVDPPVDRSISEWLGLREVTVGQGTVIDTSGRQVGSGPETLIAMTYSDHPITRGFEVATVFAGAVPIHVPAERAVGRPSALLATGSRSFERVDLMSRSTEFREGRDRRGPLTVAAAAAYPRRAAAGDSEARLVVVGDSDFATNAHVGNGLGNRDFALRIIAWLAGEDEIRIVSVADRENRRVRMTERTRAVMYAVNLGLLPLLPLIAGIVQFLRSRR